MLRLSDKYARIMERQPFSPIAESYRSLCTQLQFVQRGEEMWAPRVITVTSSRLSEGKTTTVSNLAVAFASEGKKVLLVDGDLRRPRLHEVFGMDGSKGLLQLLQTSTPPSQFAKETSIQNLDLISAGDLMDDPGRIFASSEFDQFIEQVREAYDIVLFDAPPVLLVNEAKQIAVRSDGVLLVVQPGKTKWKALQQAQSQLERVHAHILGTVLNASEEHMDKKWMKKGARSQQGLKMTVGSK
ncbi:CpsD/CapB family tyrosine-protein kinase [Paenibacillus agilis]|nr:CpsD/CapB family tyrosine-protein kinase [Paenibacillus agilis]